MKVPIVGTCESSVNDFSSIDSNVFEPSVEYRVRAFQHGFTIPCIHNRSRDMEPELRGLNFSYEWQSRVEQGCNHLE